MTAPLVLFPDVEAWLIGYLDTHLSARGELYAQGVHVDNREPNPRPTRSVVVNRNGGPRLDPVRELARVSVNVWAESDAVVTDLANMVRGLLAICPDGEPVCAAVEQSGPIPVPDESGPHRLVTVELTVRGTPA